MNAAPSVAPAVERLQDKRDQRQPVQFAEVPYPQVQEQSDLEFFQQELHRCMKRRFGEETAEVERFVAERTALLAANEKKRAYLQRIYGRDAELSPDGRTITINMRFFYHRNSTARERRQLEAEMLSLVADQAYYSPSWPWPRDLMPAVRFRNRR